MGDGVVQEALGGPFGKLQELEDAHVCVLRVRIEVFALDDAEPLATKVCEPASELLRIQPPGLVRELKEGATAVERIELHRLHVGRDPRALRVEGVWEGEGFDAEGNHVEVVGDGAIERVSEENDDLRV